MNAAPPFSAAWLHGLLPAIHRLRDAERDGELAALTAILAEQAQVIEAEIEDLYENAFIETCAEWAVPYLGALLGARGLHRITNATVRSQRAYVANTLAYRRRKGTATMLEQLAADVTGWPVRAVEFFERLATTQNINHLRPLVVLPGLRDATVLELVDGPFDTTIHTAGVRALPEGRHNIMNVGLFVWRLRPYRLTKVRPAAVAGAAGLFTFDPTGRMRAPIWNRARVEAGIAHLADEVDVPGSLRRRALYDELELRRQAITDQTPVSYAFWDDRSGAELTAVQVFDDLAPIPVEALDVCDLDALQTGPDEWRRPPPTMDYTVTESDPAVTRSFPIRVAIDPERGQLSFRADDVPARVLASYGYVFPGDVGGGPYDRRRAKRDGRDFPAFDVLDDPDQYPGGVQHMPTAAAPDVVTALAQLPNGGVIVIDDSDTYELPPAIDLPAGDLVFLAAENQRPLLKGDVELKGVDGSRVAFSGVVMQGQVTASGRLAALAFEHATLVPDEGLEVTAKGPDDAPLAISLLRSICGTISIETQSATLDIEASIVDGQGGPAIVAYDTRLALDCATVIGSVDALTLAASNSIVTDIATIARRQESCARFSWIMPGSTTPRRYRCQPDLALEGLAGAAHVATERRIVPMFTSATYGHPAYTQLARSCPDEIRTGADEQTEMGVWNFLQIPQREANLHAALDEYLRFGLAAELIPVT